MKLDQIIETYQNTHEKNVELWNEFELIAKNDESIWNHRMHIEQHKLGWGDRAFHGMWKTLIESLSPNFRFLEIGVYKGQVLSLVSLLSKQRSLNGKVFGITPLDAVGDKYWKAPESDYLKNIQDLFEHFGLDFNELELFKSLSTEPDAVVFAIKNSMYDVLYIDGGHDYGTVVFDIENYKDYVKVGGYLVMDDASCYINAEEGHFNKGLKDVSDATRDCIEVDDRFVNVFNCGHNRVFKRVK